jgi:translation initiation factor 4B
MHRPDRPNRGPEELPEVPPFTAFVGSLPFEAVEADLAEFFAPLPVVSIRLQNHPDGRPKGFGHVEFETKEGLQAALEMDGKPLLGRSLRINVSAPRQPRSGFRDMRGGGDFRGGRGDAYPRREPQPISEADSVSSWARTGPPPAREYEERSNNYGGDERRGERRGGYSGGYGGERRGGRREYGGNREGGEREGNWGGDRVDRVENAAPRAAPGPKPDRTSIFGAARPREEVRHSCIPSRGEA